MDDRGSAPGCDRAWNRSQCGVRITLTPEAINDTLLAALDRKGVAWSSELPAAVVGTSKPLLVVPPHVYTSAKVRVTDAQSGKLVSSRSFRGTAPRCDGRVVHWIGFEEIRSYLRRIAGVQGDPAGESDRVGQ